MQCPKCGTENTDNWPIHVGDEVKAGGCQECWEAECDESWAQQAFVLMQVAEVMDNAKVSGAVSASTGPTC